MFGSPVNGNDGMNEQFLMLTLKYILQTVYDFAQNKFSIISDRNKLRFDQKATLISAKEGDAVWFFQPYRSKGLSLKLQRPWKRSYLRIKKA